MLFKTKDMEEDFKERIARGIDEEYEADPLMVKIALRELMEKHHMIDLRKHLKPSDNSRTIQSAIKVDYGTREEQVNKARREYANKVKGKAD